MLLLLTGCSDFTLQLNDTAPGKPFEDDSAWAPPTESAETATGESGDSTGTACPDAVPPEAGSIERAGVCAGVSHLDPQVSDPFAMRTLWVDDWPMGGSSSTCTPPLVAWLDDDDGDGTIGPGDGPELIVQGDDISILDGATGAVKRIFAGSYNPAVTPVVGDGDGDGVPELFVAGMTTAKALTPDGALKWESTANFTLGTFPFLDLADLDQDGNPELLLDNLVFDAATGDLLLELPSPTYWGWRSVFAADLDLDGTQEIVLGDEVWTADGTLLWQGTRRSDSMIWAMPVQADADPEAELAVVSEGIAVYDTDGTELSFVSLRGEQLPGAPAVADFDGDGAQEIGVPEYMDGGFSVYELDGTELWWTRGPCRTLGAGASAFDFAGDGSYELIYPADEDFYVYDGATGTAVYTYTEHEDMTIAEYATVADVDEDGHADVIFGSIHADFTEALTVLTHDGDGWGPAGATWPEYDYRPGHVGEDNRVTTEPETPWVCPGVWRARPAGPVECGLGDLVVTIDSLCQADCEVGPGWLVVQVGNQGAAAMDDVVVDVYATVDGVEQAVGRVVVGTMEPGMEREGQVQALTGSAVRGAAYRAVVSGQPGADCDEGNNEATWTDACGA